MSVDFDNQIVSCDVNDPKDRQLASDFADQNKGFSISARDTNKGSSLMFENSEQMNTYLSNPPTDGVSIALSFMVDNEEGIGVLGNATFLLSAFGDKNSPLIFSLDGTSGLLGFTTLGIDYYQMRDNANFNTVSDFSISLISVFGSRANLIAMGLTYTKICCEGVVTAATEMAKFNAAFEKDPWGSFFTVSSSFGGSTGLR